MSARASGAAAGILLIVAGLWLLLQTLTAGLPSRLLKFTSGTSSSGATPSTSPDSPQGNLSTQPAPNPGSTATPGVQASGGYLPYVPGPSLAPLPGSTTTPSSGTPSLNNNNPKSPPAPTF